MHTCTHTDVCTQTHTHTHTHTHTNTHSSFNVYTLSSMSEENLLTILPTGVVSKNDMEHLRIFANMASCILLLAVRESCTHKNSYSVQQLINWSLTQSNYWLTFHKLPPSLKVLKTQCLHSKGWHCNVSTIISSSFYNLMGDTEINTWNSIFVTECICTLCLCCGTLGIILSVFFRVCMSFNLLHMCYVL